VASRSSILKNASEISASHPKFGGRNLALIAKPPLACFPIPTVLMGFFADDSCMCVGPLLAMIGRAVFPFVERPKENRNLDVVWMQIVAPDKSAQQIMAHASAHCSVQPGRLRAGDKLIFYADRTKAGCCSSWRNGRSREQFDANLDSAKPKYNRRAIELRARRP